MRFLGVKTAILLTIRPICAFATPPTKVAVFEIQARTGVSKDLAEPLADLVANAVRSLKKYSVVGKSDIQSLIGLQKMKDAIGCDNVSCFAELGGALGVDYIIAGNVSRVGSALLLNLRLIDPNKAEVAGGVSHKVFGGDEAIIDAIPPAVAELFGVPSARNNTGNVAGAALSVGGQTAEEQRMTLESYLGRPLKVEYEEYIRSPAAKNSVSFIDFRYAQARTGRLWGIGIAAGGPAVLVSCGLLTFFFTQNRNSKGEPESYSGGGIAGLVLFSLAGAGALVTGIWLATGAQSELNALDMASTPSAPRAEIQQPQLVGAAPLLAADGSPAGLALTFVW